MVITCTPTTKTQNGPTRGYPYGRGALASVPFSEDLVMRTGTYTHRKVCHPPSRLFLTQIHPFAFPSLSCHSNATLWGETMRLLKGMIAVCGSHGSLATLKAHSRKDTVFKDSFERERETTGLSNAGLCCQAGWGKHAFMCWEQAAGCSSELMYVSRIVGRTWIQGQWLCHWFTA